tara:strand:- start:259 stop:507 length:249 start_codon:yes stop_codon:yes gene_type:complete
MTSKDDENDWIDEHFNDECSYFQMGRIEQLLITSSVAGDYNNTKIHQLSYGEAAQIIRHLEENNNPTDPREQFQQVLRRNYK